ncbi:MAG: SET domain-containing protein [Melioribacteraceae bacterium]|mgnify:CR=1 FL=1|nr:SET domain-containing protein [Melioribacteraceae bacterium]
MTTEYPYYLNFLEVKDSPLHGKGLFTKVDIPKDSIICVIEGEVIDENECVRREEEEGNVYIFWNGDNYIDTSNNPLLKNLNHLCEPNCYVEDRNESSLFLIAECDIKAGEELTIDYDYEEIYETCQCHIHKIEN